MLYPIRSSTVLNISRKLGQFFSKPRKRRSWNFRYFGDDTLEYIFLSFVGTYCTIIFRLNVPKYIDVGKVLGLIPHIFRQRLGWWGESVDIAHGEYRQGCRLLVMVQRQPKLSKKEGCSSMLPRNQALKGVPSWASFIEGLLEMLQLIQLAQEIKSVGTSNKKILRVGENIGLSSLEVGIALSSQHFHFV